MDKKLSINPTFRIITFILMGIGIAALVYGFLYNPTKTWANYLMNNYYFLAIAIGVTFFGALLYITQSGWSSGFLRVIQAIGTFIPVVGILMIPILLFGLPELYHWAHPGAAEHDALIAHKMPYLNLPFFLARFVIYFLFWTGLTQLLRRFSLKEDHWPPSIGSCRSMCIGSVLFLHSEILRWHFIME